MRTDSPDLPKRRDHCGQCKNWSLPAGEKLSEHGMGQCYHLPAWRTTSRTALCAFSPSRHQPIEEPRA